MTLCLEDEIDISRGDMMVPAFARAACGAAFPRSIVWMNAKPLEPGRSYFIKHTSHQVRGVIRSDEFPARREYAGHVDGAAGAE